MGRGHLQAMLGKKEVEVVAVCDVVKERLDDAVNRVEKSYAERKEEWRLQRREEYRRFSRAALTSRT